MPASQPTRTQGVIIPIDTAEKLAVEIKAISEGVKKLLAGPIKRRTVMLLIADAAPQGVAMRDVDNVLKGIENLSTHLK